MTGIFFEIMIIPIKQIDVANKSLIYFHSVFLFFVFFLKITLHRAFVYMNI